MNNLNTLYERVVKEAAFRGENGWYEVNSHSRNTRIFYKDGAQFKIQVVQNVEGKWSVWQGLNKRVGPRLDSEAQAIDVAKQLMRKH